MNKSWIAPSILSCDFAKLGEEVEDVLNCGADIIHFDVMDNHYVPNLTLGPMFCKALRDYGVKSIIDVHLMVSPVDDMIEAFAAAGADYISFHPEASQHVDRSIQLIKSLGCKPAIALNPATPISALDYILDDLDMVLIMSVNPGFGGQTFIPKTLEKIAEIRQKIIDSGKNIRLEVDGGVNLNNMRKIKAAGADTFVAGSAIFNTKNYRKTINDMRVALDD